MPKLKYEISKTGHGEVSDFGAGYIVIASEKQPHTIITNNTGVCVLLMSTLPDGSEIPYSEGSYAAAKKAACELAGTIYHIEHPSKTKA